MPRPTSASKGPASAEAPDTVDVLIVTAVKEEYAAVLEVHTGAQPGSSWTRYQGPQGVEFHLRAFQAAQGELRVAVIRATEMGGEAALRTAIPFVKSYGARCIAMCGVCAGRRDAVELGDVIIANQLWNYEPGKLEARRTKSGKRTAKSKGRYTSYPLRAEWERRASSPSIQPAPESAWLATRPRPYALQMEWMLQQLLRDEDEDPALHPERERLCAQYPQVVGRLRDKGWLQKKALRLTKAGRQHIQQRLAEHPGGLPEPRPFQIHVGPIASGSKLLKDPEAFERLSNTNYTVLGLEMEAAALAAYAHAEELPWLVMKGVMDFADASKDDHFKDFAARASAECLLAFLRESPPPAREGRRPASHSPRLREQALADYKDARAKDPRIRFLDLRGLTGIGQGPHETELDLLDFAVAPSLHDETEESGRLEASIRRELRRQNLRPERRRELEERLDRLLHQQWDHYGPHRDAGVRPISLAEALARHQRLIVVGDPGTGKSVLTRLAFLACMNEEAGSKARLLLEDDDPFNHSARSTLAALGGVLPVHLRFGELKEALATGTPLSIEECLRDQLRKHHAPRELIDSLGELAAAGRLFLLCDGLDEVPSAHRKRVVEAVTEFLERYPHSRFLLTSRPHGYQPRVPHLRHTRLAPLHPRQQRTLVSRLHRLIEQFHQKSGDSNAHAHRRTQSLLRVLRPGSSWATLCNNPLMLTLTALTRTDDDGVPRHRVIVYENFIRTLLGEWRSLVSASEVRRLMDAWAAVSLRMVMEESRDGTTEERLLTLLADALGASSGRDQLDESYALRLALEAGLVRQDEENVTFWHSSLAEFLAAYALTRKPRGAAQRLLAEQSLPGEVLKLAAARLDHVSAEHGELNALARGLLARDSQGSGPLLRPGLRAVSTCLADGVSFQPTLVTQVWETWADVLETTPPSQLWQDFSDLIEKVPPREFPSSLAERFALIDDRGVREVQEAVARLVAPHARAVPAVRQACEAWIRQPSHDSRRRYAALGLASAGQWTDEVIDILGQFGETWELDPTVISEQVRRASPPLLARLRALVRIRLPEDAPAPPSTQHSTERSAEARKEDAFLWDQRLSAACLLAVGRQWDEEVARVLSLTLADRPRAHRYKAAEAAVRSCADMVPVCQTLLSWIREPSALGRRARGLIHDAALLIDDLPEAILEQTATAQGETLKELLRLIAAIGTEKRSLIDILRRWIDEAPEEKQLCAAQVMRMLMPRDEQLHAALRLGMESSGAMARVRWAYLALGIDEALTDTAIKTLQDCARSAIPDVRRAVYADMPQWMHHLKWRHADGWLACAADPTLPASARLDAAKLGAAAPDGLARAAPVLQQLLDSEDEVQRREAALTLLQHRVVDARVVNIVTQEAIRSDSSRLLWKLRDYRRFATDIVRSALRELSQKKNAEDTKDAKDIIQLKPGWSFELREFATEEPACIKELLDALVHPGQAGTTAWSILASAAEKSPAVQAAVRERLEHLSACKSVLQQLYLVRLGLWCEQTRPFAIQAARRITPETLSQSERAQLADLFRSYDQFQDAAPLWRLMLGGEDLELVLEAAGSLGLHFPEDVGRVLPSKLARLLEAPSAPLRADAARIALGCGLLEDKAIAVLLDCLDRQDTARRDEWTLRSIEQRALKHTARLPVVHELREWSSRLDFHAMQVLCDFRPGLGISQLKTWLAAEDPERFTWAMKILAAQGDHADAILRAIEHRLRSAPADLLEPTIQEALHHELYSTAMVEQLLARYFHEESSYDESAAALHWLLEDHPEETWAILLRQPPEHRDQIVLGLLPSSRSLSRDALELATEFVLTHTDDSSGLSIERLIERWCEPRESGSKFSLLAFGTQPHQAPEIIRGWLQEVLLQRAPPTELDALLAFDRLAVFARLPAEHRIPGLRSALDIDIASLTGEEDSPLYLRYAQASAALSLHELGDRDERIPIILAEALHAHARGVIVWAPQVIPFVSALLTYGRPDEPIRQSLLRMLSGQGALASLDEWLELLEQAGFSRGECIGILSTYLGLEQQPGIEPLSETAAERWRDGAPTVFDHLEQLGCSREHRAELLHRFVATHQAQLPAHTRLELAKREELSSLEAAKLLLSVLSEGGSSWRDAAEEWTVRFPPPTEDASRRTLDRYEKPGYLPIWLRGLTRLEQGLVPQWLDDILIELASIPQASFRALYQHARAGVHLADGQWAELTAQLTLGREDTPERQLAKMWLSLRLWRALEQETVEWLLNR